MCGIIGITGDNAKHFVEQGLEVMKNRGSDNTTVITHNQVAFGHNLHSIVNYVEQPFETKKYIFAANCEIYNWEQLKETHNIEANNDAELLFKLITKDLNLINELDGVYAFFLYNKETETITLARDIIGVKPIFFSQDTFAFASEKKSLPYDDIRDLNPRSILTYDIKTNNITFTERPFFEIQPEHNLTHEEIVNQLEAKIVQAIIKRAPKQPFGILFSGGIDSTIIAYICKKHNLPFTCYTAAISDIGDEAQDLTMSKKIAKELDFPLKIATIPLDNLEPYIKQVSNLIESNNVVKVGVALPFFLACEEAQKDNIKVIFSGLGSEEIFAGYERHAVSAGINKNTGYDSQKSKYDSLDIGNVNKECLSGLRQIHERDMYRDDVVTMYNKIELRLPLLDIDLIDFALKIPPKYKISKDEKKIILREVAEKLGLPKEYARRPKKAAQYGSKFDKGIEKLAKKSGTKRKSEYLEQFYQEKNLKLAALLSTGKDSVYATQVMAKQNYDITCFLTIESENPHSFLFHTPNINLAKVQAEAANIPIIIQKTKGVQDKELEDLEILLQKAKDTYQIDGVISGALFSTYQRDRFEKVCDKLGLICRNPLWHKNQESYMYELLENGVKFVMSAVMSDGLDKSWVGKIIAEEDIKKLVKLNKKTGMNVAGEGGEFETLVLDCPLFKKSLKPTKTNIVLDPERDENANYVIEEIELQDK